MKTLKICFAALAAAALVFSCKPEEIKDDTNLSNERAIISIKLEGQLGGDAVPEILDDNTGRVDVQIASDLCPDLSKVKVEELVVSYKAKASVEVGSTIDLSSGQAQIVVTSESGKTRTYTVYNDTFVETFVGKYAVKSTAFFGGVGEPDWGGLELIDPIEKKDYLWTASIAQGVGPAASNDDYFEITLDKINEDGSTEGTCTLYGGVDGKHWNCIYKTEYDISATFRTIPIGTSHWKRVYAPEGSTITFTDAEGKTTGVCGILTETTELYKKTDGTVKNFELASGLQALAFKLNGDYAWPSEDQFTDYVKFVLAPRYLFVRVEKVSEIPAASKTNGTVGNVEVTPPGTDPEPEPDPDPVDPSKVDLKGTYKVKSLKVLGCVGTGGLVEIKDKSWMWNSTVNSEYDNVLTIDPTAATTASVTAKLNYMAGNDGAYWDYILLAEKNKLGTGDMNLSGNFGQLPHGESTATISLSDGSVKIGDKDAMAMMAGEYTYNLPDAYISNVKLTVPENCIAVAFKCSLYPTDQYTWDATWANTDFDRFALHPFVYVMIFEKTSDTVETPSDPTPPVTDPVSGTYKVKNLKILGCVGTSGLVEIKDKSWMWNSTYTKEYDNILTIQATGMSGAAVTGKINYTGGADGAYWDYVLIADKNKLGTGDVDLSYNYGQLPHGESTGSINLVDGTVTIGSVSATAMMAGEYTYNIPEAYVSNAKLTVPENCIALAFKCRLYPNDQYTWDATWANTDFDRFMIHPFVYVMIFEKQE